MITISAPAEYDYYQSQAYIATELINWVRFRYPSDIADEILQESTVLFFTDGSSYCGSLQLHPVEAHRITDLSTFQSVSGGGTCPPYQV